MPFDSIFRPDLFAGQTHIVTGGGSGIGRCTAHELASLGATVMLVGRKPDRLERGGGAGPAPEAASLGATVMLVGRKPDRLERVRDEIADAGGVAYPITCDIRDEERVRGLVAETRE